MVLICILGMANEIEYIFIYILAIWRSFSVKFCYIIWPNCLSFALFLELFIYYDHDFWTLCYKCITHIFSHSMGCHFILFWWYHISFIFLFLLLLLFWVSFVLHPSVASVHIHLIKASCYASYIVFSVWYIWMALHSYL